MKNDFERDLDLLFSSARAAEEEFDVSPDFTPGVWRKIEAARPAPWLAWVRAWSPRLALGSAAAAAILFASAWWRAPAPNSVTAESSYLEILTVESLDDQDSVLWTLAGLNER